MTPATSKSPRRAPIGNGKALPWVPCPRARAADGEAEFSARTARGRDTRLGEKSGGCRCVGITRGRSLRRPYHARRRKGYTGPGAALPLALGVSKKTTKQCTWRCTWGQRTWFGHRSSSGSAGGSHLARRDSATRRCPTEILSFIRHSDAVPGVRLFGCRDCSRLPSDIRGESNEQIRLRHRSRSRALLPGVRSRQRSS